MQEKRDSIKGRAAITEGNGPQSNLPTWKQVFREADIQTQRVLVNKLIDRIDITKEQMVVRFKINPKDFLPRNSDGSDTTPYTPGSA